MNAARTLAGALVLGLLGAAVWAAIGYFTGYEIGWVAWGIGALAGMGARRFGARETRRFDRKLKRMVRERSAPAGPVSGGLAALAAVACVLAGKVLVVHLMAPAPAAAVEDPADEDTLIAYLANDIAREYEAQGRELAWPPGVAPFEAFAPEEFPPEIWTAARMRWDGMSAPKKSAYAEEQGEAFSEAPSAARWTALAVLLPSLGPFDLLWLGLAGLTAFKLGGAAR